MSCIATVLALLATLAALPPESKVREEVLLPHQGFTVVSVRENAANIRRELLWRAATTAHPPAKVEATPTRVSAMMWTLTVPSSSCPYQMVYAVLVREGWSGTLLLVNDCAKATSENELLCLMEKEPDDGRPVILRLSESRD